MIELGLNLSFEVSEYSYVTDLVNLPNAHTYVRISNPNVDLAYV